RRRSHHETAAMEMEKGADRIVRRDDPECERGSARTGNAPLARACRRGNRCGNTALAHLLDPQIGQARPGKALAQRSVELPRRLADRLRPEQRAIDGEAHAALFRNASSIELSASQLL